MGRKRANSVSTRSKFLVSSGLADLISEGNEYGSEALSGNHFRCEVSTGLWSLHCPRKFNPRPKGYTAANVGKDRTHERPDTKTQGNPFDLANSHMTPPIIHTVMDPADPSKPLIRVFENKFPVLTRPSEHDGDVDVSFVDEFFPQISAVGLHEVVVQHWRYNMCEALMSRAEVKLLWRALKSRFDYLSGISEMRFVQLLENHGIRSGGSLPHPHSQLLGLPLVPGEQQGRYNVALTFWRQNQKECVFDAILESALRLGGKGDKKDRLVFQNELMVALVPHAQDRASEMWIMPRRQCHTFAQATEAEVEALALATRACLKMLYAAHDDPDYNIVMRTAPANDASQPGDSETEPMSEWYRWHLVIIPHDNLWAWGGIKGYGGFTEVQGTPEQHAAELRGHAGISLTGEESEGEEEEEPEPEPEPEPATPEHGALPSPDALSEAAASKPLRSRGLSFDERAGGDKVAPLPGGGGSSRGGTGSSPKRKGMMQRSMTMRSEVLISAGLEHMRIDSADLVPGGKGIQYNSTPLEGNHFRHEASTGVWSLHSPLSGAVKPRGYTNTGGEDPLTHQRPETTAEKNPFDLANASSTPAVKVSVPDPQDPSKPMIRVFDNKFPALIKPVSDDDDDDDDATTGGEASGEASSAVATTKKRGDKLELTKVQVAFVDELFPQVSAVGLHEVVVQHWRYNTCEALMSEEEIKLLWRVLAGRFVHFTHSGSRYVQLLANHGVRSGGSLPHPLSQLLGLPVVPGEQHDQYILALNYWARHEKTCLFESILSKTLSHAGNEIHDRVLTQCEHMVGFVPHAQERKNEIWVMPKRQCHNFAEATEEEVDALAMTTRRCLRMLYACDSDPDYNILMRTAPSRPCDQPGDENLEPMSEWYRWHLVIIPHGNSWGGIKGYGGFTPTQGTPEQHAAGLRACAEYSLTDPPQPEPESSTPAPAPQTVANATGGLTFPLILEAADELKPAVAVAAATTGGRGKEERRKPSRGGGMFACCSSN